jgi:hypothetical protein
MQVIVDYIRRRTREEWSAYALEHWTNARIWIQEHGELAALLALFVGIFLVLAFKLVITVLVIAAILLYVVWLIALPGEKAGSRTPPQDGGGPVI